MQCGLLRRVRYETQVVFHRRWNRNISPMLCDKCVSSWVNAVPVERNMNPLNFGAPPQYLLDPAKGMIGAEVNQLHIHGGSALMEVSV